MKTKRVNRKYSKEFKEEAVALVTEQDYSASQAAEAVGIDKRLIYSWLNKATNDNDEGALSTDERKELLALRKEVKNLRMEKEILKKASAFFAKEMK